jgi:CDP-glucose 4,6-dehydratase
MENMAVTSAIDASLWRGRRVLLTGHTGFKGSWLMLWLNRLGADVTGVSLPPMGKPNLYTEAGLGRLCQSRFCDIRDASAFADLIRAVRPEIVFHLAAQALVRAGYREPHTNFNTNVMGTVNVLEALRGLDGVRVAVMVTSDKVYRDDGSRRNYRENDALGGLDPYSASKAACEMVIGGYRDAYLSAQGIAVASARSGNVIGGGDWSEDRLIPDAVRAWQAGRVLQVRRPQAVRPWQHVLEPLFGYLILAQKLWDRTAPAEAYNFGPDATAAVAVRDLVELARTLYGEGEVRYSDSSKGPYEAAWLALDNTKVKEVLGVAPVLTLVQVVQRTMAWYRTCNIGADARELCLADISDFEARASRSGGADEEHVSANTTLADLLTGPLGANPFSTVRTSVRR